MFLATRPDALQPLFEPYVDADAWKKAMEAKVAEIHALLPLREETKEDLQQYLGEVVWAAVRNEISQARGAELLSKIPRQALQPLLGDVLWAVGLAASEVKEHRSDFEALTLEIEKEGVLSRIKLASSLDMESLSDAICQVAPLKKKINQSRTRLRYTILRFNLFRENNEGYAKLIYLLDTLSNMRYWPAASSEQAEATQQRVGEDILRIIGFDQLCPNRLISLVLDFFEERMREASKALPIHCWAKPLIALLHRLPQRRLTSVSIFKATSQAASPPQGGSSSGSDQAIHKLSSRRGPSDFLAVAALAKLGLLDLDTVWMHLEPSDAALRQFNAEFMRQHDEDVARVTKIDLSAAVSGDGDQRQQFHRSVQAFSLVSEQKFKLAAALISVNHWQMASRVLLHLASLCKPCMNHFVRSALCDLLKWLIDPIVRPLQRCSLETTFIEVRWFEFDVSSEGAGDGDIEMNGGGTEGGGDQPMHQQQPVGSKSTGLQRTTSIDQVFSQVRLVLDHLEYYLHADPHLMVAMWRLMLHGLKHIRAHGPSPQVNEEALNAIMYKHLLPAASLAPPNPHLNGCMWAVLSQLPVFQRYLVYSCWETMYDRFLLKLASERTISSAKQILKRVVSNADRKDFLAHNAHYHFNKLCLSNPIPAIDVMLRSLEIGFNVNMIAPYVECSSRCSDMTADVMGYMLARFCARPQSPGRGFLNEDDATLSSWLVNLSDFVGRFYKKHPHADLQGVLTMVAKRINSEVAEISSSGKPGSGPQLYKGEALIRVVLESLMEYMGGLVTVADLNADQLQCLAGGPRLRQESTAYGIDKKKEEVGRKERARATLFNALKELGLVRVLLYSLSQQRYHFLSEEFADAHSGAGGMKLLGLLFDGNRECLLKLVEFLSQACTSEKYSALLPPISELFAMFEPSLAFHILRHGMSPYGRSTKIPSGSVAAVLAVEGAGTQKPAAGTAATSDASGARAAEATATSPQVESDDCPAELPKLVRRFLPGSFLDSPAETCLSSDFYVTFWRLGLQDIMVPKEGYEKTIQQLSNRLSELQLSKKKLEREEREKDLQHNRDYKALKKELVRLTEAQTKLKEESVSHQQNHKKVRARLDQEKAGWVARASQPGQSAVAAAAFVTEMMCPRLLTSHADALFCSNFVRLLFSLKVPGFKMVELYNCWTNMVPQFIRSCTEREAEILGIFIREMMAYALQVRKEETASAQTTAATQTSTKLKEGAKDADASAGAAPTSSQGAASGAVAAAAPAGDAVAATTGGAAPAGTAGGTPAGGSTATPPSAAPAAATGSPAQSDAPDMRKEHSKWEGRICKAMRACLESDDWMEKRNVLLLLKESYTSFPVIEKYAEGMRRAIEGIGVSDQADLKTLAGSLVNMLKSHDAHWVDRGETAVLSSRRSGADGAKTDRRSGKTSKSSTRKEETTVVSSSAPSEGGNKTGSDSKRDRHSSDRRDRPHGSATSAVDSASVPLLSSRTPTLKAAPAKRSGGDRDAPPEKRARREGISSGHSIEEVPSSKDDKHGSSKDIEKKHRDRVESKDRSVNLQAGKDTARESKRSGGGGTTLAEAGSTELLKASKDAQARQRASLRTESDSRRRRHAR